MQILLKLFLLILALKCIWFLFTPMVLAWRSYKNRCRETISLAFEVDIMLLVIILVFNVILVTFVNNLMWYERWAFLLSACLTILSYLMYIIISFAMYHAFSRLIDARIEGKVNNDL